MSLQDRFAASFAYVESQIRLGDAMPFGVLLFHSDPSIGFHLLPSGEGASGGFYFPLSGRFADGFPDLLDDLDYVSELLLQVKADAACLLMRAPVHSLPGVDAECSSSLAADQEVIIAALHLRGGSEQRAVRLVADAGGPALVEAPAGIDAPGILAANLFSHESPHRRDEVARDLAALRERLAQPVWTPDSALPRTTH